MAKRQQTGMKASVIKEKQAIATLKGGDISGLEYLVSQYQVRAVRYAFLIVRDALVSEDLVQAAFIHAYERIHQFNSSSSFGPWFFQIVAHASIKAAMRNNVEVSFEDAENIGDYFLNKFSDARREVEDEVEKNELYDEIWQALAKLSPALRVAIVNRYYLGMKEGDIATKVGSPLGTIKYRMHAALRRLRLLLRDLG